ncbi:O-antigen ligase family protein [uncultured Croceitalea sp.]|uniref:O-antigen ligase family protein n=1 Tax=uncultured Croceitalea sp. TaxID=1798908 RepID=UPI00330575E8
MNPFHKTYGTDYLKEPLPIAILLSMTITCAHLTATKGLVVGMAIIILPIAIVYLGVLFAKPKLGILTIFVLNFTILGLARYVSMTWGLLIDGLLFLMYLALFFKAFKIKIPWSRARSQLSLLVTIWFGYALFQAVNPEAASFEAWFYAMRGLALYQWMIVPLLFIIFNKPKDLKLFLIIWGIMSLLGTLKGCQQLFFGVDPFEQKWLDNGGALTHVLFGKLRIFSFYSDAGQFGASQGHAGVVFGVLALFAKSKKFRVFCIVVSLAGLYGMLISGTRGAIAVPAAGGIMFLILRKNIPILIAGAIMGIGVYVFFAHTTIMNNNAQVRRMRTAFDPNDASLQVRLANQRKLKTYLASRPFGGGIGSTGNWGQRFTPHTFLANTATDSWFVAIWADTGVVGLYLHLFILFFVLITGAYNVMFKIKDPWLKGQIAALVCGMFGIMGASYGNGVFGQFPTCILMYTGMVFMFIAPKMDKKIMTEKAGQSNETVLKKLGNLSPA